VSLASPAKSAQVPHFSNIFDPTKSHLMSLQKPCYSYEKRDWVSHTAPLSFEGTEHRVMTY